MKIPLVTVVILSYNSDAYIWNAIDSVLEQTYSNIELIISDDGTKNLNINQIYNYIQNNSKNNIKKYKIIYNDKNIGTVKNYNNAIKNSEGQYIVGLAADDVFYNRTTVEEIVNFFIKTNALIVTAYRDVYDSNLRNFIKRLPNNSEVKKIMRNTNLYKELCKGNFISGACTYYSKRFFEKYGLFDEDYTLVEDYSKYLSITRQNEKIFFIDKPTIKYRLGGVSTGLKPNKLFQRDVNKVILKEILPYKNEVGVFIYRLKKSMITCGENKFKNLILYPDIFLYNIYSKIKDIIKNKFFRT